MLESVLSYNVDNVINVTLGSSLLFFNSGLLHVSKSCDKLDKCTRVNLNLATVMGAATGLLYIYKGLRR